MRLCPDTQEHAEAHEAADAPVLMVHGRRYAPPCSVVGQEGSVSWERDARESVALAMRHSGMTYQAIGDHFGVSRTRAEQMLSSARARRLTTDPEEVRR